MDRESGFFWEKVPAFGGFIRLDFSSELIEHNGVDVRLFFALHLPLSPMK